MGETRKIAAILVADIVGYSRLTGTDEDRILARLRALRSDLIDPTIALHHGRVVKRTGDGSLIEFRSVVDAVRCAIEVQNGMVERNAGLPPERRIEFRVGIHLGDVVEEADGDLMGDGVNIAARLEGIAGPGAICLSEDAYRQVSGRLDMQVTDLGPTQLKNIEKSIRVYSLQVGVPAQPKPATEAKPAPNKRSRLALLGAGIAALLLVIAASGWYFYANRSAPVASRPPEAARLSIVVLPFANLSGDPAQDYLADALTDELTTGLSRIRDSFVIARNTAFTFKGKPVDAKAIGKDLGVRYVLEGSMQPSGNQVRINAQLIDADSGAHLWADQFDTPRADLLQMQDEIVTRRARALAVELPQVEAARLKRTPAKNPDAEDLALQCWAIVEKNRYIGKGADAGYRLCDQALAADPDNVSALASLAFKFFLPAALGRSADPKADLKRADDLASRALALDPNLAGAHGVKAEILYSQERPAEGITESQRALELDPSVVYAYEQMGRGYTYLGQFQKGLELIDKAIRLSPHDPALHYWYASKANAHIGLKQYDQAIESARRAIAINPNEFYPYQVLASALGHAGREAEAREAIKRYLALAPPNEPDAARTHLAKANQLNEAHLFDDALSELNAAIENDPTLVEAYATRMGTSFWAGRAKDVIPDAETALRLSPDNPSRNEWEFNICHAHTHMAEWEKAIEWCRKSIATNDSFWLPYVDLAAASAWLGRQADAKAAVVSLLKLQPGLTVQRWANWGWSENPTFLREYQGIVEGLRKAGLPEQ